MRPRVTWSLWNLFLGMCRCTSPATWAVTSTTATCPTWSTLCRWHRTCPSGSTIAKVRFVQRLGAGYRWGYCHHGAILLLIRGKVRKGSSSPRVEYLLVRWVHHHPGDIHLLRRPKGLMSLSSSSRWDWSVDEDGGCGGGDGGAQKVCLWPCVIMWQPQQSLTGFWQFGLCQCLLSPLQQVLKAPSCQSTQLLAGHVKDL